MAERLMQQDMWPPEKPALDGTVDLHHSLYVLAKACLQGSAAYLHA